MLDLARLLRADAGPPEVMTEVARIVSEALGFETVAINLYREDGDAYEVITVHGNDRARALLLGDVTPAHTWAPMLDPRFEIGGSFFVPAGTLEWDQGIRVYTPEATGPSESAETSWHPEDALFATLDGAGGRHYGIISVDEPRDGLRPDTGLLEVLSAIAAHAAQTFENASRFGQLQSALQRHRAVIEHAQDGVIAIDARGRVLEFNPAAEKIFGYSSADVIGHELATLVIAPEDRDAHRRGLARGFATGDWRLMGQRVEMTGIRATGERLPVELSLTVIKDAEEGTAAVYGFIRDISERRRGEEQLAFLAYHDALTGLPNRVLVEQQVELALARARRSATSVALMFVDLDDFKDVNDRLGHAAGDQLLTDVAARLRGVLRDGDVLARQGGDEFLILIPDLSDDAVRSAEMVGAKVLGSLHEPFVVGTAEVRTGASIGISLFPADATDTEALLRHADAAMYQAKGQSGGRLAFHQPTEVCDGRTTDAVLRAMVELARACDAEIIAEGVKRAEQLAFLIDHGISLTQGYLCGQPLSVSEITELLPARVPAGGLTA